MINGMIKNFHIIVCNFLKYYIIITCFFCNVGKSIFNFFLFFCCHRTEVLFRKLTSSQSDGDSDMFTKKYLKFFYCASNETWMFNYLGKATFEFLPQLWIDLVNNINDVIVYPRPVMLEEVPVNLMMCSLCSTSIGNIGFHNIKVFLVIKLHNFFENNLIIVGVTRGEYDKQYFDGV